MKEIEVLTRTVEGVERFQVHKIQFDDGTPALRKVAVGREFVDSLLHEVRIAEFFGDNPPIGFAVPKLVSAEESGEGLTVFSEWIDAETLLPETDFQVPGDNEIDDMAELLRGLLECKHVPEIQAPIDHVKIWPEHINRRISGLDDRQILDTSRQSSIREILALSAPLRNTWAHGDLMGWHMFKTEPITVIDWEHAGDGWPQFQDFSRCYVQTIGKCGLGASIMNLPPALAEGLTISLEELLYEAGGPLISQGLFYVWDTHNSGVFSDTDREKSLVALDHLIDLLG